MVVKASKQDVRDEQDLLIRVRLNMIGILRRLQMITVYAALLTAVQ